MSYILDSLGKAEQNRQINRGPELGQVLNQPTPAPTSSPWPGLLSMTVVAVLAFVLGVFTGPELDKLKLVYAPDEEKVALEDPIKGYAQRVKSAASAQVNPAPTAQSQLTTEPESKAQTTPTDDAILTDVASVEPEPVDEPVLQSLSRNSNTQANPTPTNRQPDLLISVISYSEQPTQRFAMINGSIVKQGDILAGYRVEQIKPDTVEFSADGNLFTLRLN